MKQNRIEFQKALIISHRKFSILSTLFGVNDEVRNNYNGFSHAFQCNGKL